MVVRGGGGDGGGRSRYVQSGSGLGLGQQQRRRRLRRLLLLLLLRRRRRRRRKRFTPVVLFGDGHTSAAATATGAVFRLGLYVPVLVLETAPVRGALVLAPRRFRRRHRRRGRRERLETVDDRPEHDDDRDVPDDGGGTSDSAVFFKTFIIYLNLFTALDDRIAREDTKNARNTDGRDDYFSNRSTKITNEQQAIAER